MATKKEIEKHLKIALEEIGEIKPWFDADVNAWVFEHKAYRVEYGGESAEEVIRNYPKYLREFIRQRLNDNLAPSVEKETKGRGGKVLVGLEVLKKRPRNAYICLSMWPNGCKNQALFHKYAHLLLNPAIRIQE